MPPRRLFTLFCKHNTPYDIKDVPLHIRSKLCEMLLDFKNSFTVGLSS